MGTVNRVTMDKMERVQYFVKTPDGGLRQLPFELVTIDHDFQAYWPYNLDYVDSNSRKRRGKIVGTVILDKERALPFPPSNVKDPDTYGVFEYHGV